MNCSICQKPIEVQTKTGWEGGHNAEPVNDGRCCETCNDLIVIPARLQRMLNAGFGTACLKEVKDAN
jgi:hypothetical protein